MILGCLEVLCYEILTFLEQGFWVGLGPTIEVEGRAGSRVSGYYTGVLKDCWSLTAESKVNLHRD